MPASHHRNPISRQRLRREAPKTPGRLLFEMVQGRPQPRTADERARFLKLLAETARIIHQEVAAGLWTPPR